VEHPERMNIKTIQVERSFFTMSVFGLNN